MKSLPNLLLVLRLSCAISKVFVRCRSWQFLCDSSDKSSEVVFSEGFCSMQF